MIQIIDSNLAGRPGVCIFYIILPSNNELKQKLIENPNLIIDFYNQKILPERKNNNSSWENLAQTNLEIINPGEDFKLKYPKHKDFIDANNLK